MDRTALACASASAYGGTGPVIVNASCTFLEPLVYPGEIEVRMYLGDPAARSVGSYYELLRERSRSYADGAAKIVWIDLATGRSAPLPEVDRGAAAGAGRCGRRAGRASGAGVRHPRRRTR